MMNKKNSPQLLMCFSLLLFLRLLLRLLLLPTLFLENLFLLVQLLLLFCNFPFPNHYRFHLSLLHTIFCKFSCFPVLLLYLLGTDWRSRRARAPWFVRLAGVCWAFILFIAGAMHTFPFSASDPFVRSRRRRNTV